MTYLKLPPLAELVEILEYNSNTGLITWKKNRSRTAKKGSPAGCISSCGYIQVMINRKKYMLHRIAWLLGTGIDPVDFEIDHANGNKTDNRLCNLRKASRAENTWNQSKPKSNTSGHKGVSWSKKYGKWVAYIGVNWERMHLGYFLDKEQAKAAYEDAANKYHGNFANVS
jgi:hypothetical protein